MVIIILNVETVLAALYFCGKLVFYLDYLIQKVKKATFILNINLFVAL